MLFAVLITARPNATEDTEREVLKRFANWSPAAGAEMKALYVRVDGRGGLSLFEASSAAAIYESIIPFTPFLDYEVVPILDVSEAVPLLNRARGIG